MQYYIQSTNELVDGLLSDWNEDGALVTPGGTPHAACDVIEIPANEPKYEIWGDDAVEDFSPGDFLEDFVTLEGARSALPNWQSGGRAAWIVNKYTGENLGAGRNA